MERLVLDPELKAKLNNLAGPMEFCDPSGQTLGNFLPPELYKEFLFAWIDAHTTKEEIERRRQEPRGRTLAEIWKSLGQS